MNTSRPPRILYVTSALIATPHTGCMIRTMNIARQLKKTSEVTLLAVARSLDPDSVQLAQKEFDQVHLVKLDDYRDYGPKVGEIIKKYHMHSPWTTGLKACAADQDRYRDLLKQHDLVWFHTLNAAAPFRYKKRPVSVMDLDDLNMCKYDLRASNDQTLRLYWSAKLQSYKWKKHETKALRDYDATVVCNQEDKTFLGNGETIHVVPNGFCQPDPEPTDRCPDEFRLGFIGTLGYEPNRLGLQWFRDKVWPIIKAQKPGMKLRLIGTLPPENLRVPAQDFDYLGYVEKTEDEMRTWSALIVPILNGGGTRIKILDAFSKRCPVVSTAVGAHGIQAGHQQEILLSDTPEDFAASCLALSDDPAYGRQLSEKAWTLFTGTYTWDVIGRSIRALVETLMGGKRLI